MNQNNICCACSGRINYTPTHGNIHDECYRKSTTAEEYYKALTYDTKQDLCHRNILHIKGNRKKFTVKQKQQAFEELTKFAITTKEEWAFVVRDLWEQAEMKTV